MATINAVGNGLSGQTGTGEFVGSDLPEINTPLIVDPNNNTITSFDFVASAVNSIEIQNNIAGFAPKISAQGTDTDIPVDIISKGASPVRLIGGNTTNGLEVFNGTTAQHATVFAFGNTANTQTVTVPDITGNMLLESGAIVAGNIPKADATPGVLIDSGIAATSLLGGLKSFQILSSGTAATYTTPAGITSILVQMVGGGGAGGGAQAGASGVAAGAGGGAGGFVEKYLNPAAATYTYTVGAGGTPGTAGNNPGGDGGDTTFSGGTLTAVGGKGGAGMATTSIAAAQVSLGGLGGIGTNGGINITGGVGNTGFVTLGVGSSGGGGYCRFGSQTLSRQSSNNGVNGNGFGAGGSGGFTGAATDRQGGAGAGGLIIVWEFA